jgi:6-phosphogluconolactonase
MHHRIIAAVTVAAAALTIVGPGAVAASSGHAGTVYIETNAASGNAVAGYERHADGTLTWSADYATGGKGTGAGLGSQGSVALSADGRTLVAVNAGSDDVSAFAVGHDGTLHLVSRAPAGGTDPISVAIHGDLVYVLDAGGDGNIAGLLSFGGHLLAVPGWTRPLSGAGTSPEQIAFSPDGRVLVVTEKGANEIVTYRVGWFGRAGAPDVQASAGAAPYGFAFDSRGRLFVSEAATSALSSYSVGRSGHLTTLSASVVNGQLAACWVALTPNGREAYAIDAHSSTISSYAIHANGSITLDQGLATSTGGGTAPLDASVSPDGRDLYVLLSATQQISSFAIGSHGTLTAIGTVSAPFTGLSGLVAR